MIGKTTAAVGERLGTNYAFLPTGCGRNCFDNLSCCYFAHHGTRGDCQLYGCRNISMVRADGYDFYVINPE